MSEDEIASRSMPPIPAREHGHLKVMRQHQQAAWTQRQDHFHPSMSRSLSPQEMLCFSANRENCSHVSPGLLHGSIWPQYFNLFHQHLPSDLWFPPKSQRVPLCGAPTQRPQINYNCWILNIQGHTPPDMGPNYAETRSDPGLSAALSKLQRMSCPSGRRAQRLASKVEESPVLLTKTCVLFNALITKVTGIQHTHAFPPNKKENTVPFHLTLHLTSYLHHNLCYYLCFIEKDPEPQKVWELHVWGYSANERPSQDPNDSDVIGPDMILSVRREEQLQQQSTLGI